MIIRLDARTSPNSIQPREILSERIVSLAPLYDSVHSRDYVEILLDTNQTLTVENKIEDLRVAMMKSCGDNPIIAAIDKLTEAVVEMNKTMTRIAIATEMLDGDLQNINISVANK